VGGNSHARKPIAGENRWYEGDTPELRAQALWAADATPGPRGCCFSRHAVADGGSSTADDRSHEVAGVDIE
jgi:hypothetical protein